MAEAIREPKHKKKQKTSKQQVRQNHEPPPLIDLPQDVSRQTEDAALVFSNVAERNTVADEPGVSQQAASQVKEAVTTDLTLQSETNAESNSQIVVEVLERLPDNDSVEGTELPSSQSALKAECSEDVHGEMGVVQEPPSHVSTEPVRQDEVEALDIPELSSPKEPILDEEKEHGQCESPITETSCIDSVVTSGKSVEVVNSDDTSYTNPYEQLRADLQDVPHEYEIILPRVTKPTLNEHSDTLDEVSQEIETDEEFESLDVDEQVNNGTDIVTEPSTSNVNDSNIVCDAFNLLQIETDNSTAAHSNTASVLTNSSHVDCDIISTVESKQSSTALLEDRDSVKAKKALKVFDPLDAKDIMTNESLLQPSVTEELGENILSRSDHVESVHTRKVYGEQSMVTSALCDHTQQYTPFTTQQLNSVYHNAELVQDAEVVDKFIQSEQKKDGHEFYEIMLAYFRARCKLISAEHDVRSLQKRNTEMEEQLWITTQAGVSAEGYCGDGVKCLTQHVYDQCEINVEIQMQLTRTLQDIRTLLQENCSLHAYSAQLARLQVESYLHQILLTSPELRDIPRNAPVQALVMSDNRSASLSERVYMLRECISVLFNFHRRPVHDRQFVTDIRNWTERLVAAVLRVATLDDHMFILHHVLRSPTGVGQWAADFIQVLAPPSTGPSMSTFGSPLLDHALTVLANIIEPIRGREQFMISLNYTSLSSTSQDQDGSLWILVDSDGEEDEDPSNAWLYLHENDLVALLKQFPMDSVFKHVFLMDADRDDILAYDVKRTSAPVLMKVFAFSTCLVGILHQGLQNLSKSRYKQLNKRIGRMIRHTVHYVSDHWHNFKALSPEARIPEHALHRLQLEFDQFFLRATHAILIAERLGSWQFMAEMPFAGVSLDTMWKLLWLLHQERPQSLNIDSLPNAEKCAKDILEHDSLLQFADALVRLPMCEAVYLLTTFANMAQARPDEEKLFIQTIVREMFEIAYVSDHTRDFCSKPGRDLLSAIATAHPFTMSDLLQYIYKHIDRIGMMALHLAQELPLYLWLPAEEDMIVLRHWLLNSDLISPQSKLVRALLSNMNWAFNQEENGLAVPLDTHRQVALLIVDAYTKVTNADKHVVFAILEGMKQVATNIRQQLSPEQQFTLWVWDVLLRLHLHTATLPLKPMATAQPSEIDVPDLERDSSLRPLLQGVHSFNTAACYTAVAMTSVGHSVHSFLTSGLDMMLTLSNQGQHQPVIQLLFNVAPMFYESPSYLSENEKFQRILHNIMTADDTYMRLVKSLLVATFPSETISLLASMIQTQIMKSCAPGAVGGQTVILFWLVSIFMLPHWHHDRNCCYIVDNLIKSAFSVKGGLEAISELFKEQHQNLIKTSEKPTGGGLSSFMHSWLATSQTMPSFLERQSSEFAWLAYMILDTEAQFEHDSLLWRGLQHELSMNADLTVDQAHKKASVALKLAMLSSVTRLNIYRWASQAEDTPPEHPLLPVIFQRFFVLYLGRPATSSGIPQRASIGERFFDSSFYVSALKRLKKRLAEAVHYHRTLASAPGGAHTVEKHESDSAADNSYEKDDDLNEKYNDDKDERRLENTELAPDRAFHQGVADMCQTMLLWLDEPRLHDANLYLPALPPVYNAEKLLSCFHGITHPWLEYVDADQRVEYELAQKVSSWVKRSGLISHHRQNQAVMDTNRTLFTATQRIMARFKKEEIPEPPPVIRTLKAPVPEVNHNVLKDKQAILYLLNSDLNTLTEYAKLVMSRLSKHVALDCAYLELLPEQYRNTIQQVTLTMECKNAFNPKHKCRKAAVAQVQIEEKTRDETVQRKLDENRAEYKQVMIEGLLPLPQNICISAVHVENVITALVKTCQSSTDANHILRLYDIAATLFYHLATQISHETKFYPPTRQFFSSCVDILGQEFVRHSKDQVEPLLQFSLDNPSLAGLMSPHFVPNIHPQGFLSLYEQLAQVAIDGSRTDLVFTLLTKFDVGGWLQQYNSNNTEVCHLLNILTNTACACGLEPEQQSALVLEMLCSHVESILRYQFPAYLNEVLQLMLTGCAAHKLSIRYCQTVYRVLCQSLPSTEPTLIKNLPIQQIQSLLEWFGSYFMRTRMTNVDCTNFGLYPTWKSYSAILAKLLQDLNQELALKMIHNVEQGTAGKVIDYLWKHLCDSFSPWLQPFDNQPEILSPWLQADESFASAMVTAFTECITIIHDQYKGAMTAYKEECILSVLWHYYAESLGRRNTPEFVINVFHISFLRLPWQELQPTVQCIQSMAMLHSNVDAVCVSFMYDIVLRIPWPSVIATYEEQTSYDLMSQLQAAVFHLLMQMYGNQQRFREQDAPLVRLLLWAEGVNWSYLNSVQYHLATDTLLQVCAPLCILAKRSSIAGLGIRLLKVAAGFNSQSSGQWTPDLSSKRIHYVHCVSDLLCQCSYQGPSHHDNMCTAVLNLMTDIETVTSAVPDIASQKEESLAMMKQLFGLLNRCNPQDESTSVILNSIIQWLQSSPNSVIVLPGLQASSQSLASLAHMAQIAEACLDAYFPSDASGESRSWGIVLSTLQIPELSLQRYLTECLNHGSYLTLYAYILQQLPFCQNPHDEWRFLDLIAVWLIAAKPECENEVKLMLWLQKFVELLLRQIDAGTDQTGCAQLLHKAVNALVVMGEDRSASGILGAIGFGKKSMLSPRFRMLIRGIAAFLGSQLQGENRLRLHPGAISISCTVSKRALHNLQVLRGNKAYQQFNEQIEQAWAFTIATENVLRHFDQLLLNLSHSLYPGTPYLSTVI